jgi:hypothetical protein
MPKTNVVPSKKKKEVRRRLDDVIYYAVDKASPYALARHKETDSLAKISGFTLLELSMTPSDVAIMWTWINAYCQPDAKPISADVASKAKTVAEVRAAVYASAGIEVQA